MNADIKKIRVRVANKFMFQVIAHEYNPSIPEFFQVYTAEVSLWDAIGGKQLSHQLVHITELEDATRRVIPEQYFDEVWNLIKTMHRDSNDIINS